MIIVLRRFLCAASLALGLGAVQPASSASILIFGNGFGTSAGADLEATLTGLGHSVVNAGGTTVLTDADFAGIDTAWFVGSSFATYIPLSATPIMNFVNAGGGLHLTGENNAVWGSENQSMLNFLVNPLLAPGGLTAGGVTFGPVTISAGLPANLAGAPNPIAGQILDVDVAGTLAGLSVGKIFAHDGSEFVGAIFDGLELNHPDARMSIIMDANWLSSPSSAGVIENLQIYLQGGPEVVAAPEPGTALLLGAAGLFVAACRRRKRA